MRECWLLMMHGQEAGIVWLVTDGTIPGWWGSWSAERALVKGQSWRLRELCTMLVINLEVGGLACCRWVPASRGRWWCRIDKWNSNDETCWKWSHDIREWVFAPFICIWMTVCALTSVSYLCCLLFRPIARSNQHDSFDHDLHAIFHHKSKNLSTQL